MMDTRQAARVPRWRYSGRNILHRKPVYVIQEADSGTVDREVSPCGEYRSRGLLND